VEPVRRELCQQSLDREHVGKAEYQKTAVIQGITETTQCSVRSRQVLEELPGDDDIEASPVEAMLLNIAHDPLVEIGMTLELANRGVDPVNVQVAKR
jgi:hypothetical protein